MKKYVNDQLVDMTAAEIAERQAEEQAWADGAAERNLAALRKERNIRLAETDWCCLLYTSPSPRDGLLSRMPSSA